MRNAIRSLSGLALALYGLGSAPPAKAANIVANPGFESGLTGWTSNFWAVSNAVSWSGTQSAYTGCQPVTCISTPTAYLYQDLTTVSGATYIFSFYFWDLGFADGSPFELEAMVDGSRVAYYNGSVPDAFFRFSLPAITFTAASATTRIQFNGRDVNRFLYLDQVCVDVNGGACGTVQDGAFIPEPSTWMLTGGGLAAGLLWRLRRLRLPAGAAHRN